MSNLVLSTNVRMIKPSATLGMAQAARELADTGVDVVMMSTGEPDFQTPSIICEAANQSLLLGKTHYTPIRGTKAMISAMRQKFKRDQGIDYSNDEVLCTVGGKAAILYALEAIVNQGDEVIIFAPFWISYAEQIRFVGGMPVIVECKSENGFMPTARDLALAITNKTKAIILNSPNNPSGAVITRAQLEELAGVINHTNIWLISDEIYEKLLFDENTHFSPASLSSDMRERTVVISGVSKGYAMTGWRVGVVAGNKSLISGMVNLQGLHTTCLPEFIQDAATFALKENDEVKAEIKKMVKAYQERRDLGLKLFKDLLPEVKVFKPEGAFYIWADFSYYLGKALKQKIVSDDIDLATRMLKEAHVACVPGSPFGAKGFLRFSIASAMKDIENGINRIKNWLM